jgi:hypothetical protein
MHSLKSHPFGYLFPQYVVHPEKIEKNIKFLVVEKPLQG